MIRHFVGHDRLSMSTANGIVLWMWTNAIHRNEAAAKWERGNVSGLTTQQICRSLTINVRSTSKIWTIIEYFRFVANLIHSFAMKYVRHADSPSFCWYWRACGDKWLMRVFWKKIYWCAYAWANGRCVQIVRWLQCNLMFEHPRSFPINEKDVTIDLLQ